MKFILFILLSTHIFSQHKYPADSLLKSNQISIIKKFGIVPISIWQRISYNTTIFDCQFYPSCSNYGTDAVKKYGIIKGGAVASERITRCNPKAYHYQLQQKRPFNGEDGRLIDPVNISSINDSEKSPYFAALISVIVPGSGRFYAGRRFDGISGLLSFILYSSTAYRTKNNKNKIATSIFTSLCFYVYLGEIYGGWRTAKYYQPSKLDLKN